MYYNNDIILPIIADGQQLPYVSEIKHLGNSSFLNFIL